MTAIAPPSAPIAPAKNATASIRKTPQQRRYSASLRSAPFPFAPQWRALERLREQHLLGEDQVAAVVVGHLVLVAHRDRVERARDLAVAAEDAAREVDLIHSRVALPGRNA